MITYVRTSKETPYNNRRAHIRTYRTACVKERLCCHELTKRCACHETCTGPYWISTGVPLRNHFHWESDKLLQLLCELSEPGRLVGKKLVEQSVGLLLWYCGGACWPLAIVGRSLGCSPSTNFSKPHCVLGSMSVDHFGAVRGGLSPSL